MKIHASIPIDLLRGKLLVLLMRSIARAFSLNFISFVQYIILTKQNSNHIYALYKRDSEGSPKTYSNLYP